MHFGFVISLLLHAALLAWALFTIQTTPELRAPDEQPIEVALITPSELLRLKQGALDVTELEAKAKEAPKPEQSIKEAPKPKPIEAPTPPAAEPPPPVEEAKPKQPEPPKPDPIAEKLAATPPPEPTPGPTPEEKRLLEEKVEQERKAEEKRKADEIKKKLEDKKKAEERKKRIEQARKEKEQKQKKSDADRLAALLNKDPTQRGAPNSSTQPTKPTDYTGRTAGANQGNDTVLSATEKNLLASRINAQLRQCWRLPGGGGGAETVIVTLKWNMRPDGSLEGEPSIVEPQSGPVFQTAAEAAIRAVKNCTPFDLPPDMYQSWKTLIVDFDPADLM